MKVKLFLIVMLITTLACINSNGQNQPDISPDDAIATSVAATLAASGNSETQPPPSTQAPPPPPSCQPLHPGAQSLLLPSALATGSTSDQNQVNIYDFQSNQLGIKNLSGITWQEADKIHFAAGLSGGLPSLPVIFYTLSNGNTLKLEQNGIVSQLAQTPELLTIVGQKGGGTIAYSLNSVGQSGWISSLFATPYGDAGTATVRLTRDQGDGYVIWPLAVHTAGGQAQGVWYTESMYGIGNILFHPYRDLLYMNMSNNQATSYLGSNTVLAGFSPDQTWVAYAQGTGATPGQAQGSIKLKNLITCQEITLTFHSTSNLGGGWVIFAPDNQMVAWIEASGPDSMNATYRLRIARIDGTLIVDSPINNLYGLAGGVTPTWILPRGWSANHLVVLEIHVNAPNSPLMVLWAPDQTQPLDPSLGANQSILLGDGSYMGFIYP